MVWVGVGESSWIPGNTGPGPGRPKVSSLPSCDPGALGKSWLLSVPQHPHLENEHLLYYKSICSLGS